jgi:hypothetical protein
MQKLLMFLCAGLVLNQAASTTWAADLKLEARLIWGANDEKETVKYKPVDPELAENLHRMFKWKNYYQISNQTAAVPLNKTCTLNMSDHCTLQVKNVGASRVEVNCIGEGKQVHRGAYTLVPPQWLVLGGNDKDNTAWFIGLRAVDNSITDSKKAVSKN